MLMSSSCDYSDAQILVQATITVFGAVADDAAKATDRNDKHPKFKNCAPFADCISEITNKLVDNAKDLDVAMPMYNLIEYSDNYSKKSRSSYDFCRDEPKHLISDSESYKFKSRSLNNTTKCRYYECKNSCAIKILKLFLENS